MTSEMGLDLAWDKPATSTIKATGARFIARYLSPDSTKNLTADEVTSYTAAGMAIVVVWEGVASRMLAGYAAGVADAKTADAQRKSVGLPDNQVIYFACDFDASGNQFHTINEYMRGVNSVIGLSRSGFYGGYYAVESVASAPASATYFWQTEAWSDGKWSAHANIRQEGGTLLGGNADYDYAETADYGQYPRPIGDEPMTPADVELFLNTRVEGAKLSTGYVPTVWEMLNGSKLADSQLTALQEQVVALAAEVAALKLQAPSVDQISSAVQAGLVAGITQIGKAAA